MSGKSSADLYVESLRPQIGDDRVFLPLTIDKTGYSSRFNYINRIYFSLGLILIGVVGSFSYLIFSSHSWFIKPFVFILVLVLITLIIRYAVLEEYHYRSDIERQDCTNLRMSTSSLWGIFSIEEDSPHVCYYRSGSLGIFVLAEKNVLVGHDTYEHHFQHYTALADAYRAAAGLSVEVTHIDLHGTVGYDNRIDNLFLNISDTDNTDLRDVLSSVYSHLRDSSQGILLSTDIFLLTHRSSRRELLQGYQAFTDNLLGANYLACHPMNQDEIKSCTESLFNLEHFSALSAIRDSIDVSLENAITPVSLTSPSGEVKKYPQPSDKQ